MHTAATSSTSTLKSWLLSIMDKHVAGWRSVSKQHLGLDTTSLWGV
jgi:hypothetical protein